VPVLSGRDLPQYPRPPLPLRHDRGGKTSLRLTLQIVRRPDDLHAFQLLPRRWVVERTLSWITRHRRTVRDYERLRAHHETYVYWAMIIVMTRRLARSTGRRLEPRQATSALAIRG
jgi:Transposase DDE domain